MIANVYNFASLVNSSSAPVVLMGLMLGSYVSPIEGGTPGVVEYECVVVLAILAVVLVVTDVGW